MCNTNCCKKEEDLICAMPIPFCGCDKCCPIPCGGCFKDDGCCGCCCDCDDSCCYCKYYKLLKELRDRLEKDENRITNLESSDIRINNKIDNMYQDLMHQLVQIAGDLEHEVCDRHDDIDNEQARAEQAENDLYQYIKRVDIRETDHHEAQALEIQRQVNYLLDNADPAKIDSFREMLQWVNSQDTTIIDSITQEITNRTNADNGIKDRLTVLETLTGDQTVNRNATLVPDSSIEIALVNNKSITVGLPAYPTELKNPKALKFSGHSSVTYDGSVPQEVHIPDDTSDLHFNTDGYINALGVGTGAHSDEIYYKVGKDNNNYYLTVPYATKASQDGSGNNISNTYLTKSEGVTAVGIDSSNRITYTINGVDTPVSVPYLTSHQGIKTLNTNNSLSQTESSSESITGTGSINLHKISKTGKYDDLVGAPTLANVATSGDYNDLINTPTPQTVPTVGSLNTNNSSSLSASSSESFSNSISLNKISKTGDWSDVLNKPSWIGSTKPSYTLDEVSDGSTRKLSDYAKKTEAIGGVSISGNVLTFTSVSGATIATITLPTYPCLWEVDSNDNTKIVAKDGKAAKAAGFYDSTVS